MNIVSLIPGQILAMLAALHLPSDRVGEWVGGTYLYSSKPVVSWAEPKRKSPLFSEARQSSKQMT